MEEQARCKKCGRVLKSPASIARGIGSTCAGTTGSEKSFKLRIRRGSTKPYATKEPDSIQNAAFSGDLSNRPVSKREVFRKVRDERRKLFEERRPFQCGVLTRTHTPLIYLPLGDSRWKESHSGRVIPHEKLQAYLKRFSLI
jgi:hypothetical protein